MNPGRLIIPCLVVALAVPACDGEDPVGTGESPPRVLGSGTWGSNFCTIWEFEALTMSVRFPDAPALELMRRDVANGDDMDPVRSHVVVLEPGSPAFAPVVARLTDGQAETVEAKYEHTGGAGWLTVTETAFFHLDPLVDFAGREITALRFVVDKAEIGPREGGGTCAEVAVHLEVLGRWASPPATSRIP